jgi:DNA-binding NarL/FixJ family response regulator
MSPHPDPQPPIRVVLADDHPLVLDALEQQLGLEGGIEVVGRCTRGEEVCTVVRQCRSDVLILDLVMKGQDGLSVLRELGDDPHPPRTIMLSGFMEEAEVLEAMRLGVRGVLMKDMAPRLIVQCVRKVHAGGEWLEQERVGRAVKTLLRRTTGEQEAARVLTPRELELVRLVAVGMHNKDIAQRLEIAEGTVKLHLHSVYDKLGIDGRVALTIWARDRELV